MWQISSGLDGGQFADALEIPEDAGEYADALRRMLVRIPDGWGRWIRCERGWYPLLAELDADLAALLPRYEIYQVKEKFGGLRLYWPPRSERTRLPPRRRVRLPSRRRGNGDSRCISERRSAGHATTN
jgi:hypothetical protein